MKCQVRPKERMVAPPKADWGIGPKGADMRRMLKAAWSRILCPEEREIFQDPDGNEMIMVRGECYPVIRLHQLYHVKDAQETLGKGILVLVETGQRVLGVFADRLLGVQEIVVKPVPKYIQQLSDSNGISGCTLLGDGSISLVLDAQQLGRAIYTS